MDALASLLSGGTQQTQQPTGRNSQVDQMVDAFKRTQSFRLTPLQTKKTQLETSQRFFGILNTRFNNLISSLDSFDTSSIRDKFAAKKATSSDESFVNATAGAEAVEGINTVKVLRLATNDLLVSSRNTLDDAFGGLEGDFSFEIIVGGQSKQIDLNLSGEETYKQAYEKIIRAINNTEDVNVVASVVNDTSTTGRISLTAKNSGQDGSIEFGDSPILAMLGLNNSEVNPPEGRKVFDDTSAGYRVSNATTLNSLAEVNGINVTRSSNSMDDVLSNITINLVKVHGADDSPAVLNTEVNNQAVEQMIEPLLKAYNDILALTRDDKTLRRSEPSISNLYQQLRLLPTQRVTGLEEGALDYISALGIRSANNGSLSIENKDRLKEFLINNPEQVADVFLAPDGFIAKLNKAVEAFKGDNGLIKQRTLALSTQINDQTQRITRTQDAIDRQAATVRKQYESQLKAFLEAQAQFSSLMG